MTALYNEIEPFAAKWLRNLSDRNLISPGVVVDQSIQALSPRDVQHYTQAHFFAGIGVWSYALRLAGWPDDVPVWTGSCPCQPFSTAGRRGGFDDERHLWPVWFKLIDECRPPVIFGEQVASPDGLKWFDAVSADLENAGYSVGAADLCAAGVGAPHIRQRLFFVAYANVGSRGQGRSDVGGRNQGGNALEGAGFGGRGVLGELAHHHHQGLEGREERRDGADQRSAGEGSVAGPVNGFWRNAEWLPCRDGKSRPVEPGTFPLVDGAPGRVGRLRAYGNAIVSEVAATFVKAAMPYVFGDGEGR